MASTQATTPANTLDVAKFLEDRGMTRFHIYLLVISSCVTFFDGLDFSLISFTLPYLREEMALTDTMTGLVSSAAFLGQMIGSLVGSYIADIVGRRPVIIWCTLLSAVLTFITGFADGPWMLIVLRLLGGLAIGGLLAPAWSINIESMPAGKKARAVTIIMLGFSFGGAAAGQVTNFLAPVYGWEGVFFACGAATGVLALILLFTMPESARWLAAKGKPADRIVPLLNRFDPAADLKRFTHFVLSDERKANARQDPLANLAELFRGWLIYITPLIWFAYFCSSFAIYLKSSFGVLFLEELGIERTMAADLSSIGGMIGAIAGVLLLVFTEKRGPAWIAAAPLLGIPLAMLIGSGALLEGALFIPVVLAGSIMISAGHAAVISITSIYYPSAVRATGGGWASFMAKFAAVAAPNVGAAWFLSSKSAVLDGYMFTALCLVGVVIGLMALAYFARKLAADRLLEDAQPQPAE
ncbi:aromatic acid/H+ symport family MFS transporter [Alteraurantiacibacter aestuarii]|uniref:MFS transporter n=1 Tax=Alteraurantiacibacter aestuarii TaxID=650004 RepID=A0A844ZMK4_9SPHN|nr:MFS transporter [Alteraurantiacibacter aestuarii]MXO88764.1 MFS transporter [Alteraurantiacibacter aestuarii]